MQCKTFENFIDKPDGNIGIIPLEQFDKIVSEFADAKTNEGYKVSIIPNTCATVMIEGEQAKTVIYHSRLVVWDYYEEDEDTVNEIGGIKLGEI